MGLEFCFMGLEFFFQNVVGTLHRGGVRRSIWTEMSFESFCVDMSIIETAMSIWTAPLM